MTFQELKYHIESYSCSVDHIEDNIYNASNPLSFTFCEIENLSEYSDVALVHYFYEIGIPAIPRLSKQLNDYRELRLKLKEHHNIPLSTENRY